MGYFSELDIELQEREAEKRGVEIELIEEELDFDWQAEQARDEAEQEEERRLALIELNDPDNLTGWMQRELNVGEGDFGQAELDHIESLAEIQEEIHAGNIGMY